MMKKYFEQEFKYGIYSKIYYMIALFLIVLFGITLFLNYSSVNDTYNEYLKTMDYYQKNGLDIKADLAGKYAVEESGNSGTITNPILYYKVTVGRYIYAASPKYTISQLLESSILYFPVVFGILGLLLATNDFKYKTIKLKTVRMEKTTFGMAKQLSLAYSSFMILVIGLMISYLLDWLMYAKLSGSIPISEFHFKPITGGPSIFIQFIFGYIVALIFAEIGYTMGVLFKNVYVGMIGIIAYMFLLPNLGSFDLKNAIYYFAHKAFNFYGVVSVEAPKDTSFTVALLIIVAVVILAFFINLSVIKKRSSFES